MRKKLSQNKGETLVETLFALLIAVLSVGLLASSVNASINVNMQTRKKDEKYKQELQAVECVDVESEDGLTQVLRLNFKDKYGTTNIESANVTVEVFGEEDAAFLSYDYEPGGDGT